MLLYPPIRSRPLILSSVAGAGESSEFMLSGRPIRRPVARMKSFERYRRYAADCLKMAQSASNDGDKAHLLQMAETWRHLAKVAEAQATARDDEDT
jgi:hypothetical protein